MAATAVDTTPLLQAAGSGDDAEQAGRMKAVMSECKLQEQCFLSTGATSGSEAYRKVQRKLVIACVLCFIFMIIEVVGGYIAKSVAIMSDAAHMLSDVSAFLVSIFAAWAASQPSSWHYSFGYHRAEILGALVSVLTIWAVTGALVFEAVQRTMTPVRVDGKLMFIISIAGVVFNILIMLTLGVHGHLGHSHGPGGCSGHGHSHGDDHSHSHGDGSSKQKRGGGEAAGDHSHHHGHSHGHQHEHGSSCSGGSAGAQHKHAHSHSCSSASSSAGPAGSDAPAAAPHKHSHSHDHGSCGGGSGAHHDHDHPQQQQQQLSPGKQECIVINLPTSTSVGGGSSSQACGQAGHAVTCRCTISRRGSREIEVRYELPSPAAAGGHAAQHDGCSGHSHGGHGHGHSHDHGGHGHGGAGAGDINLRGAVLHVIGDLLQSIGVAIAGGLIWLHQDDPRWYLADPICTFVFSVVVLLTTRSILMDIVNVLMERTPHGVDVPAVSEVMSGIAGIRDVHDLHIWTISTSTSPVLTAHVHIGPDADATAVLQQLEGYVRRLGIDHSTIQICNPAAGGSSGGSGSDSDGGDSQQPCHHGHGHARGHAHEHQHGSGNDSS